MEQSSTFLATKRYSVVTGANKGIGFEICGQLASNGVVVVLTARDENRGLAAVQKLIDSGISDENVVFRKLDVTDPDSIASLVDFVKAKFGKLDILVNNAGVLGVDMDAEALQKAVELAGGFPTDPKAWAEIATQSYELAEECVKINYYGAKRTAEALVPLLLASDAPRIVNVSGSLGLLKNICNEWAKGLLNDVKNLTEERVDEVLNQYLKDYKEGLPETKGWPSQFSAAILAKATMNAHTRILATKYPSLCVNSVCPGFTKTDLTKNHGNLTAAEGAEHAARLALMPIGGPSGNFYIQKQISCF